MPVLNSVVHTVDVASRLLLLLLLLLVAQSLLWAAGVPILMKIAAIAIAALAFARPADGLVVVAALAPLGVMFGRVW